MLKIFILVLLLFVVACNKVDDVLVDESVIAVPAEPSARPIQLRLDGPVNSLEESPLSVSSEGDVELVGLSGRFHAYGDLKTQMEMKAFHEEVFLPDDTRVSADVVFQSPHSFTFDLNQGVVLEPTKLRPWIDLRAGNFLSYRPQTGYSALNVPVNIPIPYFSLPESHQKDPLQSINVLLTDGPLRIYFQDGNSHVVVFNPRTEQIDAVLEREAGSGARDPILFSSGDSQFLKIYRSKQVRLYKLPELTLVRSYLIETPLEAWWWEKSPYIYSLKNSILSRFSLLDGSVSSSALGASISAKEELSVSDSTNELRSWISIGEVGRARRVWTLQRDSVRVLSELELKTYKNVDSKDFSRRVSINAQSGALVLHVKYPGFSGLEAYSHNSGSLIGWFDTSMWPDPGAVAIVSNNAKFLSMRPTEDKVAVFETSSGRLAFELPNCRWNTVFSDDPRWMYATEADSYDGVRRGFTLVDLENMRKGVVSGATNFPLLGRLLRAGFDAEANALVLFTENGYVVLN